MTPNAYSGQCTITANGGDTPRAWNLIRYSVAFNIPQPGMGRAVWKFDGVQSWQDWPVGPDAADIVPAKVGSPHPFTYTEGTLTAYIREYPAMAPCTPAPGSAASRAFKGGGQFKIDQTTTGPGGPTGLGPAGGSTGTTGDGVAHD